MIGTLVLLIAIFFGAYWFSKKMGQRYQVSQSSVPNGVELLVRQVIGKDEMLLIVRISGRVFLLGVTPQHIEMLKELDPEPYQDMTVTPPTNDSFRELMKGLLKNVPGKKGDGGHGNR